MQLSKPLLFQTLCYAIGVQFKEEVVYAGQESAFFENTAPFKVSDVLQLNAKSRPITTDAQIINLLRLESGVSATADPQNPATVRSLSGLYLNC